MEFVNEIEKATASCCVTGNIIMSSITSKCDLIIRLYSVAADLVISFIFSTLIRLSMVLKLTSTKRTPPQGKLGVLGHGVALVQDDQLELVAVVWR